MPIFSRTMLPGTNNLIMKNDAVMTAGLFNMYYVFNKIFWLFESVS